MQPSSPDRSAGLVVKHSIITIKSGPKHFELILLRKDGMDRMANESKRVKSEAGKAMHSKSKVTRSLGACRK